MNAYPRALALVALSVSIALAAPSEPVRPDTASVASATSLPPDTTTDSGIEAKLAAAQAAWDAGSPAATSTGSPVSGRSLGGLLLQLFTGLAVLALAVFALLLLVQRARRKTAAGTGGGLIDLLEAKSVGPSRQVALVRIHNRVVAVAFSGSSATTLAEFQGTEAAEILAESGTGKASIRDFAATLDTLMDRFRAKPDEKPSGGGSPE